MNDIYSERNWAMPNGNLSELNSLHPDIAQGGKHMTKEEIKARIEKINDAIFYNQMADYMDFSYDASLKAEKKALQEELKKMEGGEC